MYIMFNYEWFLTLKSLKQLYIKDFEVYYIYIWLINWGTYSFKKCTRSEKQIIYSCIEVEQNKVRGSDKKQKSGASFSKPIT